MVCTVMVIDVVPAGRGIGAASVAALVSFGGGTMAVINDYIL